MAGLEQLLIGRTLDGRYDIKEVLGTGRTGSVYRALHNRLGSEVAIKVISAPRKAETRERYRRLLRQEATRAAALRHPNLPLVIGSGTDRETDLDFFVTELLEGERLSQVLAQRGRPPAALALRVFADAVAGVAAAHGAGILHRDLRPANLYLVRVPGDKQKRVRVLGFGVPQIVRRGTATATELELVGYSPPEMLMGGRMTAASDVFGIGVIGWQLLTGSLPYDEAARRDLAVGRSAALRVPPELEAVPPHVVEAIVRALRPDPAERFADVAAFAAALDGRPEPRPAPAEEPAAAAGPAAAAPVVVASAAAAPVVATKFAPVAAPPTIVAATPPPAAIPVEPAPIAIAVNPTPAEAPALAEAAPALAESAAMVATPVVAETPIAAADPAPAAADLAPAVAAIVVDDAPAVVPAVLIAAEGSILDTESEPVVAEQIGKIERIERIERIDSASEADSALAAALVEAAPDAPAAAEVPDRNEPAMATAAEEPAAQSSAPAQASAAPVAEPYRPPPPPRSMVSPGIGLYHPPEAERAPVAPLAAPAPVEAPPASRIDEPEAEAIPRFFAMLQEEPEAEHPVAPEPVQMSLGMTDAAPAFEPDPLPARAVEATASEVDAEEGPTPLIEIPRPGSAVAMPAAAPVFAERRLRFAQPRKPRPRMRPSMAAGFVLGILVVGSVAWVATRPGAPLVADEGAAVPAASQLAEGAAVAPASEQPVPAAEAAAPPAATVRPPVQPLPTPTTPVAPTPEQRAALARQAQQQAAAAAQKPAAQPAPAPAPPPAAARTAIAPPAAPPPAPAAAQPQPQPSPAAAAPREQLAASAAASRSAAPEVYDISRVEQRPTLANGAEVARTLQSRYPRQMQQNRVEGRVMATFVVREDGSVDPSTIRVLDSPNAAFNTPTTAVLRRARFTPARVDGAPVKVQVTMPVAWKVNE